MADEEKKDKKDEKKEKSSSGSSGMKGMLVWGVFGLVVVVLSSGAGIGANMVMNAMATPAEEAEVDEFSEDFNEPPAEDYEYYAFDPLTVNLKTRNANRYLKIKLFLAVRQKEKEEVFAEIEAKKLILKNWLMLYLQDQTLEDVSGKKNQVRIQREIAENFNRTLWPDRRPRIEHILFDEFTTQ